MAQETTLVKHHHSYIPDAHKGTPAMMRNSEQVVDWAKLGPDFMMQTLRRLVRLLLLFMGGLLFFWLYEPIAYLQYVPQAVLVDVVDAMTLPWLVYGLNAAGMVLVIPQLVILMFAPRYSACHLPKVCVVHAAMGAALSWFYLAWTAYPLDFGGVWIPYFVRACGSCCIALAFAYSINAQQLIDAYHQAKSRKQALQEDERGDEATAVI